MSDGGKAFPQQVVRDGDGLLQDVAAYGFASGASRRDLFAAFALQGLLAGGHLTSNIKPRAVALSAWRLADEMLATELRADNEAK